MGAPRGNKNAAGSHSGVSKGAKYFLNQKSGRNKVTALLTKYGNNPSDVKKMVKKHFRYASRVYPTARIRANVIRTIY